MTENPVFANLEEISENSHILLTFGFGNGERWFSIASNTYSQMVKDYYAVKLGHKDYVFLYIWEDRFTFSRNGDPSRKVLPSRVQCPNFNIHNFANVALWRDLVNKVERVINEK